MQRMLRYLFTCLTLIVSITVLTIDGRAQQGGLPSHCLAMVDAPQHAVIQRVATTTTKLDLSEVRIRYVGHSTFRIETANGVVIATDYAGHAGDGPVPTVVTMNRAHSSHFTHFPDKEIKHVLRGWNPEGGPARHNLSVKDVRIRNVPTDIRDWAGGTIKDGNSIFIFEAAGLCIGHVGHLHHKLTPEDIGQIGRLDILFVPVDGTFTMDQESMAEVATALKARLVIPMHYFSNESLNAFLLKSMQQFEVEIYPTPDIVISGRTLPEKPKMLVLPSF